MFSPLTEDLDARLLGLSRHLVRDLGTPSPRRYWVELGVHSAVGWSALCLGALGDLGALGLGAAVAVASLAWLRSLAFLHELVHQSARAVPGLEAAWTVLWGVPFFRPAWVHQRAHLEHHRLEVHGTAADPGSPGLHPRTPARAALLGALAPLGLVLRFLVLSPVGWCAPRLGRLLDERFSSLAPNEGWRPPAPDPALRRTILLTELACFTWGWGLVGLTVAGRLPSRAPAVLLAVLFGGAALDQLRALVAHRRAHADEPGDELAMVRDAVNLEASWLTWLLLPLGSRLHALHHLAPSVPFHHLEEAHRRLVEALPPGSAYPLASEPGLGQVLRRLWAGGQRPVDLRPRPPLRMAGRAP